jgi:hypothetical protein
MAKYLVAVKIRRKAEVFSFKTKKGRNAFVKYIKTKHPRTEYATATKK